jgi:hypothetical protein
MKKIVVLLTAAFLFTGVSFAQDKTKEKAKCTMACCKDGKEKCGKDCKGKDAKCGKSEKKDTKKKA